MYLAIYEDSSEDVLHLPKDKRVIGICLEVENWSEAVKESKAYAKKYDYLELLFIHTGVTDIEHIGEAFSEALDNYVKHKQDFKQ